MREQKCYLAFHEVERGIIIRSLNALRNRLLLEGLIGNTQTAQAIMRKAHAVTVP